MPIRELLRYQPSAEYAALKTRLIDEWRNPNSSNQQPIIIVEQKTRYASLNVFVIWDEWRDMEQLERSEMIMDAYREVFGQEASYNVTVAMGLTQKEAERMKIHYK